MGLTHGNSPLLAGGQVLITYNSINVPPTPTPTCTGTKAQQPRGIISKLLLKAFCVSTKKDSKTFTLRNVNTAAIGSCEQLKCEIRSQLCGDIVQEFDVGYLQGSTLISIRTPHDLSEIWNDANKGNKVILWCDGLKEVAQGTIKPSTSRRRKHCVDSDDDDSSDEMEASSGKKKHGKKRKSVQETREEKVEETVNTLKEKHGKTFTQMQYHIWGEMVGGGLHSSLDDPRNTSMSGLVVPHQTVRDQTKKL